MVSIFAFYSGNPSSNSCPAGYLLYLEKMKINVKETETGSVFKTCIDFLAMMNDHFDCLLTMLWRFISQGDLEDTF